MPVQPEQRQRWQELTTFLDRVDRKGVESLSIDELKRLCQLYRHVTMDLSRGRTNNDDPDLVRYLNFLVARAHGCVYRTRAVDMRPIFTFLLTTFPRLVRTHARYILVAMGIFWLTSAASFLAVVREPDLAYSLFDENLVEYENVRLEKQEGEYKGNFTFDVDKSPFVAVAIISNNVRVAMTAFGLGALVGLPGVLLLVYNGRMLGTLSGLVWNRGYFLDFYGLILTHGVIELTAICISAGAGLMMGWSLIAPGQLSRRDALKLSARPAFGLLAGCIVMLIVAGIIEAYVTPHFSKSVRWIVAGTSALWLVLYFGFAGRGKPRAAGARSGP